MKRSITVENVTYSSIAEAAEKYNISYSTVLYRLEHNWCIEEVFGIKKHKYCALKKKIPISVENVKYSCIEDAAKAHGIKAGTVKSRLRRGWTINQAFGVKQKILVAGKSVTVEGVKYGNLRLAAEAYGCDQDTVRSRVTKCGWTLRQALNIDKRKKTVSIKGVIYPSLHAAADDFGVPSEVVYRRIKRGYSPVDALTTIYTPIVINKKSHIKIKVAGERYNSIKDAANFYQLSYGRVIARIRAGWTTEEVFGLKSRKEHLVIKGRKHSSLSEAARYHNISPKIAMQRISFGWSIEEALELKCRKVKTLKRKEITIKGKKYPSLSAAAKAHGINRCTVNYRLKKGWSLQEAFEL